MRKYLKNQVACTESHLREAGFHKKSDGSETPAAAEDCYKSPIRSSTN